MKKSDLKTGMRVKTRKGELYLVLKDCETGECGHQDLLFVNFSVSEFLVGSNYERNLKHTFFSSHDIVEVFTTDNSYCDATTLDKTSLKSIWKRGFKFTYEGFMDGEFVVNCRTQEDANMFFAYLTGKGVTWCDKNALLELNIWERYKERTCYNYRKHTEGEGIEYGIPNSYESIITFTKEMLYE